MINLWTYRRLADAANFQPGTYAGDVILVNWPQNDYFLGNLVGVCDREREQHIARATQLSLSLLYWLQTEAPRADGGQGFPGLRLRDDLLGSETGVAKYPYVRESRRILARFTVLEQHVGREQRDVIGERAASIPPARLDAKTAGVLAPVVPVGEIAIETPTIFEFALNAGVARTLDIAIPFAIRASADEVID